MSRIVEIITQFQRVASNPQEAVEQYQKETGKGAVGLIYVYAPEEIIHAAGYLPVGLWGGSVEISRARAFLPSYLNFNRPLIFSFSKFLNNTPNREGIHLMNSHMRALLGSGVLAILLPVLSIAQSELATLTGTVTDPSTAVLAGVSTWASPTPASSRPLPGR